MFQRSHAAETIAVYGRAQVRRCLVCRDQPFQVWSPGNNKHDLNLTIVKVLASRMEAEALARAESARVAV